MKTNEQILERYLSDESGDFFSTQRHTLLACLPYKMAKPYLDENYVMEHDNDTLPEDERWEDNPDVRTQMMNFMPMLYSYIHKGDTANTVQGLLCLRSWLWMLEEECYEEVQSQLRVTVAQSPEDLFYKIANYIGYKPIVENIEFEELPNQE